MKKYVYILCLVAFATFLPFSSVQGAIPTNRIVAVVNGEMVSMYDLEINALPQIMRLQLNPAIPQDKQRIEQILKGELVRLIDEIITSQEAERRNIVIDDARVDAEFTRLAERSRLDAAAFAATLIRQGTTESNVKAKIRQGLLRNRLLSAMVARKVVVTDKDIDAYLLENPDFAAQNTAQRVTIGLLIYPPSVDAKAEAKRITEGALSFEKAVQTFSVGPNKAEGGNVGELEFSDLEPSLRKRLAPLQVGQVTEVFELNGMQTQAKLLQRINTSSATAKEPNREAAAEALRNSKTQERFTEYMEELRKRAVIDNRF